MKKFRAFISAVCIVSIMLSCSVFSSAVSAEKCSYKSMLNNKGYAPLIETAQIEDSCLYYSILSTAGSYAKKYFNATDQEADFDEESIANTSINSDVHNFGEVLYKSVGCNIGNEYAITSVEFLTGRGERYLKEKISENGAIVAAFAVPNESGLINSAYYNEVENSFVYLGGNNDKYHAASIVGWDDSYDVNKYNKDSNGKYISRDNGAWICKNSYGTDFGDDGYFYMSYSTPLLYTAAVEVSKMNGANLTLKANQLLKYIGFIYGVNIRAFSEKDEEITIKVGKRIAFHGKVKLKNGCNLILFDEPVISNKISITGNNVSVAPDTVYCYTSLLPNNKVIAKPAEADKNWNEDVESIWISADRSSGERCITRTNGNQINHTLRKNSNDNCYYIIPADGYRFTDNTKIETILGFDNSNLKKLYPNDYKAFIKNSTIAEAVAEDYKRIKNGDGTFKTMIEFYPEYDDGRGMLKIVGQGIASAFVNELNILTDENGVISSTMLTFDDGSVLEVPAEISLYKDEAHTQSIQDIKGLDEYCAEIIISGYYSKNLVVKINGTLTDCTIKTDGEKTNVEIKIPIPDITDTLVEIIKGIRLYLAQFLNIFRFRSR